MKRIASACAPRRGRNYTKSIATLLAAAGAFTPAAQAANIYWDGITGGWNTAANWSTDPVLATPDPASFPVAADLAFFNISSVNAAEVISLNAAQAATGLVFSNTGTTGLQGGGTNQVLTLGTSGILVNAGAGAVTIGSATAGQNVAITLGGAQAWTNNAASLLTVANGVTNGANLLTVSGTGNTTISGVIGNGAGGITKTGNGILTLSAANTYTGVTSVLGGTLTLTAAAPSGAAGTLGNATSAVLLGDTTGAVNASLLTSATVTIARTINVQAGNTGVITLGATGGITATYSGAVTLNKSVNLTAVAANSIANFSGVISGAGGLTKVGLGTVGLNAANTFGGAAQIAEGTLQLNVANALPNVPLVFGQASATTGTLQLNGFGATTSSLSTNASSTSVNHLITNMGGAATLTVNGTATDIYKGSMRGGFTLAKAGTGSLEIQAAELSHKGGTTISGGTVNFNIAGITTHRGSIAGSAGTVTKSGGGIFGVLGAYNFTGTTNITNGTMVVGAGTSGPISATGAGVLGVGLQSGRLTAPTVGLGPAFVALLDNFPTALLTVSTPGGLSTSGVATPVSVFAGSFVPGNFPLISYSGAIGGSGNNFTMPPVGQYPHISAAVVDTGSSINLNVTAVDSLIWTGGTAVWDVNTTTNFKLASDGTTPANFFQGDSITFDDTAITTGVTVTGAPIAGDLTFNNVTKAYTLTGTFTGPGGISQFGAGTTTIASATSFSGPINVAAGTLNLNAQSFSHGAVNVVGGTLRLGVVNALSSGATVNVSNGGTLDVNGVPTLRLPVLNLAGAGVGGNGALVNNGAAAVNLNMFEQINMTGNASWGGSARYDAASNTLFNGNGFTLTKVGGGELWFWPTLGTAVGAVTVNGGTFGSQTNNPLGAGINVTVNSGAFHSIFSTVALNHNAILNDGGTLRSTNGAPTFNGTVTLNGSTAGRNVQAQNNTTLNVAGKITGPGGFTLADAGILVLQNAGNDYAGDTVVSGTVGANTTGTLSFGPSGVLPSTTNLIVNSGIFATGALNRTIGSLAGTGGTISGGATMIVNQSSTTIWNGALTATALRKNGSGSLTLGGAITGNLELNDNGNLTTTGTITGVTVQHNGSGALTLATLGTSTVVQNGTGLTTMGGSADNSTVVAIANSGTLVLAKAAADFAQHSVGSANLGLTVNNGAIAQIAGSRAGTTGGSSSNNPPADIAAPPANYVDQIFNFTEVQVNTGGTLDLNGRIEAIDGLAGGGTITNTSATAGRLYVGYNNTTSTSPGFLGNISTFSGVIQDGAGVMELRKIGTGTLVLSGANTYSGGTTVTAGTLNVTGSLGNGLVTVAAGATLATTGSIAGSLQVNGTGHIGGNVAGDLSVTNGGVLNVGGNTNGTTASTIAAGTLTFAAAQTRTINIDFNGTAADRVNVSGVNGLTLSGTSNVNLAVGPAGWVTGSYPIYTYNGAVQGTGVSSLVLTAATGHNVVSLADNGTGTISLSVTAAAPTVWVGNNGSAWDTTTTNWTSTDSLYANGDAVQFTDSASSFNPALAANVTPAVVVFNNTTNNYTLSGAAGIAGSAALFKTGTGTLTLSNPNTYTGATNVQQGTLVANFSTGTPLAAANLVNVSAGATARLVHSGGVFTLANPIAGAGTVVIDPSTITIGDRDLATVTWDTSAFTGILNLKPSLGTMRLQVDNAADLGNGTVQVDNGGQVFVTANSLVFPQNFALTGSGFTETAGFLGAIRAANPSTFSGAITVNGAAKIGALGGVANFSGPISGGTLTFGGSNNAGAETMNLTGNASGLTGFVVNEGVATGNAANIFVNVGNGTATGTLGNVPITLKGDAFKTAILRFERTNGYTLGAPITAASPVAGNNVRTQVQIDTLGTGFDSNGQGIILGATPATAGNFFVGNVRDNAVATVSGPLTANTLQVGALNTGATTRNAVLNLTSGAVVNVNSIGLGNGGNTAPLGNTNGAVMNIGPGVTLNSATVFHLGEQNSSSGTVNQTGGDVTVAQHMRIGHWPNNTSTYTISGGTLTVANNNTATNPSGTVEQNGGIYLGIDGIGVVNQSNGTVTSDWIVLDNRGDTAGTDIYNLSGGILAVRMSFGIIRRNPTAQFAFSGGTIRNIGTGVTANIDTPLTLTGTTATIDTNGATNAFNIIQPTNGTGALTKIGNGTLIFASRGTHSGGTTVNAGTLQITAANAGNSALGSGPVVINSGATLETMVNGFGFTDGQSVSSVTVNGGTLRQVTGGGGPDSHLYTPVTLNGATMTGGLTSNIFRFHRDVAVQASLNSSVLSVAQFSLEPVAPGANPGTIANPGTVTFNVADGAAAVDLNVTGVLNGPGGLTKIGSGLMALTGANTYAGATAVNAGTFLLNGSITGAATINAGGTLAGSGTAGTLAVAGGTLAPGNGVGTLNSAAVTLGGGIFAMEISNATTSDKLNVTGGVAFTANTALTLDFSTYDPVDNVDSFTLILNDLADGVALGGNVFTYGGNPLAEGATFTAASGAFTQMFQITYAGGDSNDVVLNAVPEPGSALMLLGGFGVLLGMQRSRRRR
jgi:autotransporter-associated beta strand protein